MAAGALGLSRVPVVRSAECRSEDDRGCHGSLLTRRDQCAHHLDQLVCEEWVQSQVVHRTGLALVDLDVPEPLLFEFVDEVTLRQRTGHSAGPGGRMGEELGWKLLVANSQIGNGQLAAGHENARTLGKYSS